MKKLIKAVLVSIACLTLFCSCDKDLTSADFSIGGTSFTCIEHTDGDYIYAHDQTGTLYVCHHDGYAGFTFALLNPDGTAYTLEQYSKDKSSAKTYRDQE